MHAKRADRRDRWRGRFGGLITLIGVLIGSAIIAVTVFDAPARLGFGASGKDRLEQLRQQLATTGCTVLHAPEAEYASSAVSKLVGVAEGACIRVFAAGGPGHGRLGLQLFSPQGKQLAETRLAAGDPQLQYCSVVAQTLRFQIELSGSSKGRLSHMVMTCPAPPPKPKAKITGGHHH